MCIKQLLLCYLNKPERLYQLVYDKSPYAPDEVDYLYDPHYEKFLKMGFQNFILYIDDDKLKIINDMIVFNLYPLKENF